MNTVRERRLQADFDRLAKLVAAQPSLTIESTRGNPPESYVVVFRGRSIAEVRGELPVFCDRQRMKIEMPADYPAVPPLVTVFGAIFHPHIWPRTNVVCLGAWNITEFLDNLVLRLRSMVHYDSETLLNRKSVANEEAAEWASRNQHFFPLHRAEESRTGSTPSLRRWYETA